MLQHTNRRARGPCSIGAQLTSQHASTLTLQCFKHLLNKNNYTSRSIYPAMWHTSRLPYRSSFVSGRTLWARLRAQPCLTTSRAVLLQWCTSTPRVN